MVSWSLGMFPHITKLLHAKWKTWMGTSLCSKRSHIFGQVGARKDCTSQEACRAQQRKDKFPSLAPVPKWKRLRASQHQRKFMVPISCMKHATSCNLTRRPPANLYLQNQNRLVKACLYFPIPMRFLQLQ